MRCMSEECPSSGGSHLGVLDGNGQDSVQGGLVLVSARQHERVEAGVRRRQPVAAAPHTSGQSIELASDQYV